MERHVGIRSDKAGGWPSPSADDVSTEIFTVVKAMPTAVAERQGEPVAGVLPTLSLRLGVK